MARRLWGCYSVADHLERRAFVADVLLYDRLVVPVPSSDDLERWEERWDPARQQRLLAILGGLAEREEWSNSLRRQFAQEWSPGDAALDLAYGATRRILSDVVWRKAEAEKRADSDILAFAVYAKPDRFDREWELSRAFPFVRRAIRVAPGAVRELADSLPTEQQQLAKIVVTRLVVPDDGRDDEEVLKRTVDLVSREDVARRRAEFHDLIASLGATGLRDETIIGEIEDLLDDFNESIRRHTKAQRARVAVQVLTTAEGGAALWAPPVALASGPTAAAGEALIKRRWGGGEPEAGVGAVSLLAEAQRVLKK